eukprot:7201741-Lingulodinium_polyedra.AAC.1
MGRATAAQATRRRPGRRAEGGPAPGPRAGHPRPRPLAAPWPGRPGSPRPGGGSSTVPAKASVD